MRLVRAGRIRFAKRAGPARDRHGYVDETPKVARSEPQAQIERGRAEGAGQPSPPHALERDPRECRRSGNDKDTRLFRQATRSDDPHDFTFYHLTHRGAGGLVAHRARNDLDDLITGRTEVDPHDIDDGKGDLCWRKAIGPAQGGQYDNTAIANADRRVGDRQETTITPDPSALDRMLCRGLYGLLDSAACALETPCRSDTFDHLVDMDRSLDPDGFLDERCENPDGGFVQFAVVECRTRDNGLYIEVGTCRLSDFIRADDAHFG